MAANVLIPDYRHSMESLSLDNLEIYGAALLLIWMVYLLRRARKKRRFTAAKLRAYRESLLEPPSLHPVINPNRCVGCASCVSACPEQATHQVLGIIGGKAELISAADCIGHGACRDACPTDAITLVFGTARRGIDIPMVKPSFETNVPGIFIAGELGGMGLIRNAIEQGKRAIGSIARLDGIRGESPLDVVIVGAGPAGFAASLAAMEQRLRYLTVEQDCLGGTVFQYPRGKIVMTAPVELPSVGKVKFRETTKEDLLDFWRKVERQSRVRIKYKERVEEIVKNGRSFEVKTTRGSYRTRAVLLAIGRRGTPRKLGVPGEDLPKVVYRLTAPEQYRGQRVLVVGGGDSALEAATSVAAEPGSNVTLSYRGDVFSRPKEKNRQKVKQAEAAGRLTVLFSSNVKAIMNQLVHVEHKGKPLDLRNDGVIVSAGGILPADFLKKIGIQVETKYGTP